MRNQTPSGSGIHIPGRHCVLTGASAQRTPSRPTGSGSLLKRAFTPAGGLSPDISVFICQRSYHHLGILLLSCHGVMCVSDTQCRFSFADNLGFYHGHAAKVVDWVRTTWPFWNASGGSDHVLWWPADQVP